MANSGVMGSPGIGRRPGSPRHGGPAPARAAAWAVIACLGGAAALFGARAKADTPATAVGSDSPDRPAPVRRDGHALIEVRGADPATLRALSEAGIELLDDRPGPGPVHLIVPPSARATLLATGLPLATLAPDVQVAVDAERTRLTAAPDPSAGGDPFLDDFRDFPALDARLDALAAEYPDVATLVDVGTSIEDRPIRGIRIWAGEGTPAAVLVSSTMHAREWLATMTAQCVLERLLEATAGGDPALAEALQLVEVTIVPVLNPDGYIWSWDVDRYWRKNRRDGIGVDLNRNFSVGWGGEGSSGNPDALDYRGPEPLSEPESTALTQYVLSQPNLVSHLDLHTYGQVLLYPYSYSPEDAPDLVFLSSLGTLMAEAMQDATGEVYTPMSGWDLYPAAGVVDDWSYDEAGLMAYVPELRPSFSGPGDFVVPPSLIEPTCDETLAALGVVLAWAGQMHEPPPGESTGTATTQGDSDDSADDTTGGAGGTGGATKGEASADGQGEAGPGDDGQDDDGPTRGAGDGAEGPADGDGGNDQGDAADGTSPTATDGDDVSGTDDAGQQGGASGCGCRTRPGQSPAPLAWFVLLGVALGATRARGTASTRSPRRPSRAPAPRTRRAHSPRR